MNANDYSDWNAHKENDKYHGKSTIKICSYLWWKSLLCQYIKRNKWILNADSDKMSSPLLSHEPRYIHDSCKFKVMSWRRIERKGK